MNWWALFAWCRQMQNSWFCKENIFKESYLRRQEMYMFERTLQCLWKSNIKIQKRITAFLFWYEPTVFYIHWCTSDRTRGYIGIRTRHRIISNLLQLHQSQPKLQKNNATNWLRSSWDIFCITRVQTFYLRFPRTGDDCEGPPIPLFCL